MGRTRAEISERRRASARGRKFVSQPGPADKVLDLALNAEAEPAGETGPDSVTEPRPNRSSNPQAATNERGDRRDRA